MITCKTTFFSSRELTSSTFIRLKNKIADHKFAMHLNHVEHAMLSLLVVEKYLLAISVFLSASFESILKSCYRENLESFFLFNEALKTVQFCIIDPNNTLNGSFFRFSYVHCHSVRENVTFVFIHQFSSPDST